MHNCRNVLMFLSMFSLNLVGCVRSFAESDIMIRGGGLVQDNRDNVAIRTVALVKESHLATGRSFCTGTVIGDRTILTAAHCFMDISSAEVRVVFAREVKSARAELVRKVIAMVPHEGFNPRAAQTADPMTAPNDIALVRFEGDLPQPYVVTPLLSRMDWVTDKVTLVGYGLADVGKPETVGFLRAVDVKVDDRNFVRKVITTVGENHAQALPGDSGGPAFVFRPEGTFVSGVDSTDGGAGRNTYTAVPPYQEWIRATMASMSVAPTKSTTPVRLTWNIPDLERGMANGAASFNVVASNQGDVPGVCKVAVSGLRRYSGMETSYALQVENGGETAEFSVEAKKYLVIKFIDPRASQNRTSKLVQMELTWSCNGMANKTETIRSR